MEMFNRATTEDYRIPKKSPARFFRADVTDERLVRECLEGNEQAWSDLVDKYKNLIFSIPLKYRATREDAADIFQTVCLELFSELPNLRKAGSLRSWLKTVTAHKSFHWKRKQRRITDRESNVAEVGDLPQVFSASSDLLEEVERAQMVRDAVAGLPARCNEIIRLLFYEQPPVPYLELSKRLGLAEGSIGFIRGRCLKRLEKRLSEMGFAGTSDNHRGIGLRRHK